MITAGNGPTSIEKKPVLVATETSKYVLVPLKKHLLFMPQKQIEIYPGVLKKISTGLTQTTVGLLAALLCCYILVIGLQYITKHIFF